MNKLLILCKGVPGSGKSYMAQNLKRDYELLGYTVHICSADNYFMYNGKYCFEVERLGDAHKQCQDYCRHFMSQSQTNPYHVVIIDNTNLVAREAYPYIDLASMYGYQFLVAEPQTFWANDAFECFMRNTHYVPLDKIKEMLTRKQSQTLKEYLSLLMKRYTKEEDAASKCA